MLADRLLGGTARLDAEPAVQRDAEVGEELRGRRLRLKRVPEEHQQIDLALSDAGTDLLVAAERPAEGSR